MKKLFFILIGVITLFFAGCGDQGKTEKPSVEIESGTSETGNESTDENEEIKENIVSPITNGGEFKTND